MINVLKVVLLMYQTLILSSLEGFSSPECLCALMVSQNLYQLESEIVIKQICGFSKVVHIWMSGGCFLLHQFHMSTSQAWISNECCSIYGWNFSGWCCLYVEIWYPICVNDVKRIMRKDWALICVMVHPVCMFVPWSIHTQNSERLTRTNMR